LKRATSSDGFIYQWRKAATFCLLPKKAIVCNISGSLAEMMAHGF
jgi:hypothetical protein